MLQSRGSFLSSIPPVTKNLIIINFLMWLATIVLPGSVGLDLVKYLGLHYWGASDFNPAQIVTYMFMHDPNGLFHILFNMFTLLVFGKVLEQVWGGKRFLFYFLATGIGAGIVQEIVWMFEFSDVLALNPGDYINIGNGTILTQQALLNKLVTIGASGAVFGILLAFGMIFPNVPMYLFFIPIPIKAKYIVIGYGVIELFLGLSHSMSGVAHFAHLGGMLFGLIILLYWKKKGLLGGHYF